MSRTSTGAVCLILITLLMYLSSSPDSANCVVSGSESADGYYLPSMQATVGVSYWAVLADLFDIVSLHGHIDGRNVIELGKGGWVILTISSRECFSRVCLMPH